MKVPKEFVVAKITGKEILQKVEKLEGLINENQAVILAKIDESGQKNAVEHSEIQGQLAWHQWLIVSASGVGVFAVVLLIGHVMGFMI